MICKICGVKETNKPDEICDICIKLRTGVFAVDLYPQNVPSKGGSPVKINYEPSDISSKFG